MKHSLGCEQEANTHKGWGLKQLDWNPNCISHLKLKNTQPYHLSAPACFHHLIFCVFLDHWRRQSASWRLWAKTLGQRQGVLCGDFEGFWSQVPDSGFRAMSISVLSTKRDIFCLCKTRSFVPQVLISAELQSVLTKFGPTSITGGWVQKSIRAVWLMEISTQR